MIPFFSASGTSFHSTKIEVEVVFFNVKFLGGALGTENYNFITHENMLNIPFTPMIRKLILLTEDHTSFLGYS